MEFFNFRNAETFHFFKWLCHSGCVDVEGLIELALQHSQAPELFELGFDLSRVAREKLAELLEVELVEAKAVAAREHRLDLLVGTIQVEDTAYEGYGSLLSPLLYDALEKIDLCVAAEALIRRAGKWVPYTEFEGNAPSDTDIVRDIERTMATRPSHCPPASPPQAE
jgi:hypothetical protein